ncbi:MAG: hypothetical protein HY999_04450 [Nitrospinae bacterium]|nr:hypothetical protein [Nitrospinota bacterium]
MNINRIILLFLLLFIPFSFFSAQVTSSDDKVFLLKYKFVRDDILKYKMNIESTIDAIIGGEEQRAKNKTSFVWTQGVKDVDKIGTAQIETTYRSVKANINVGFMSNIYYDSTEGDSDKNQSMLSASFNSIIGKNFIIDVAKDGKVLSVSGFKDILDGIITNLPGGPMRLSMADQFSRFYNDKTMTGLIQNGFQILPNEEIKIGDSWSRSMIMPTPITLIKIKSIYTLKEVRYLKGKRSAVISIDTKIESVSDKEMEILDREEGGTDFLINIKNGHGDGIFYFDIDKGRVVESSITAEFDVSIKKIEKDIAYLDSSRDDKSLGLNTAVDMKQNIKTNISMELL